MNPILKLYKASPVLKYDGCGNASTQAVVDKYKTKRDEYKGRALSDFKFFLINIWMGGRDGTIEERSQPYVETFHDPLINTLNKHNDSLVLLPRGTLKSEICSVAYPVWLTLKYPDSKILIMSETLGQAKGFVQQQIKAINLNELLKCVFPEMSIKGDSWYGSDNWYYPLRKLSDKEPTVKATSIDSANTGTHPHVIIYDDLIGKTNYSTVVGLESAYQAYNQSQPLMTKPMYPTQPPNHTVIVGTRWSWADFYGNLLEDTKTARIKLVRKCWDDEEMTIPSCPTMLDADRIHKLQLDMTASAFSAQYMNQPISDSEQIFRIQDIEKAYYDEIDYSNMSIIISVDPAESVLDSADYTGIAVVGRDASGHMYLLDMVRQRMKPSHLYPLLHNLNDKYRPLYITIESNGVGRQIIDGLYEYDKLNNDYLNIREIKNVAKKEVRIIAQLEPLVRNNLIHMHKVNHSVLIDEMLRFPLAEHDDILDALAMCCDKSIWGNTPQVVRSPTSPLILSDFPVRENKEHTRQKRRDAASIRRLLK